MANNAIWLEDWTVNVLDRRPNGTIAIASYDTVVRGCPKCGAVDRLYKHGRERRIVALRINRNNRVSHYSIPS